MWVWIVQRYESISRTETSFSFYLIYISTLIGAIPVCLEKVCQGNLCSCLALQKHKKKNVCEIFGNSWKNAEVFFQLYKYFCVIFNSCLQKCRMLLFVFLFSASLKPLFADSHIIKVASKANNKIQILSVFHFKRHITYSNRRFFLFATAYNGPKQAI